VQRVARGQWCLFGNSSGAEEFVDTENTTCGFRPNGLARSTIIPTTITKSYGELYWGGTYYARFGGGGFPAFLEIRASFTQVWSVWNWDPT